MTIDETLLYHYDLRMKQQSMEWRHSVSPRPKNSECKNPLEKFSPHFLVSRRHPPHCLPSKGPNYQRGELLVSFGTVEGHFEGKTSREDQKGVLVLARKCPGSPDTCNTEEIGLPGPQVSRSLTLFSGSNPVRLLSVPWNE